VPINPPGVHGIGPATVQGLGHGSGLTVEDIILLVQQRVVAVSAAEFQVLVDAERDRALAIEALKADATTAAERVALEAEKARALVAEQALEVALEEARQTEAAARQQADTNLSLELVDKADLQNFNNEVARRSTADVALDKRVSHIELTLPTAPADAWISTDGSNVLYETLVFGFDSDGDPYLSIADATGRWGIDTDSDPYFDSALAPLAGVTVAADADNDIVIDTGG
jgi:hypothetical protein